MSGPGGGSATPGAGGLVRLILRRDRVILPLWILALAALPTVYASSLAELYPTQAGLTAYANGTASNPSMVALLGPLHGDSLGALTVQRCGFLLAIIALASLLTVVRHTRTEEEAGRRELLGSAALGRHAGLTAALLVTVGADAVLGLLAALGLLGQGLPATGAVAFGLAVLASGAVFAAVGAVTAQLSESAGAARGLGLGVLGLAFLLRLAGDSGGRDGGLGWLSWLSPVGWVQQIRAFAGERWWVLAPAAGLAVTLAALAYALSARRDVAAGVLPPRLGPATAAPSLRSPLALAWRLHRNALIGWSVGFGVLGTVLGGAADAVREAADNSPDLEEILVRMGGQTGFVDAYLAGMMGLVALGAAGYAISAALRMRTEEAALRSEPLLAAAVPRLRWTGGHLVFALLGPAVVLAVGGAATALSYGAAAGDTWGQLPRVLGAALVQLPAVWVLAGLAVALFGLVPRLTVVSWAALAACVLLGQLGAVLRLSQALLDVSPFTHVPRLPGGELTVPPLAWLLGVALVLTAAGLAGFRRRDVPVS
ncbi:ABC transporter permease [Micromonospora sp. NPDC049559]|uniref:ABC transporter permease n=1 Tax=Micromonospora sp. NPDC049559 TaxID=3155923 RepID=UPI00342C97B1